MKDRIIKNWETTLFGCIILIAGLAAVFMDKATLTEFACLLPTILILIRAKSTLIWIPKKK